MSDPCCLWPIVERPRSVVGRGPGHGDGQVGDIGYWSTKHGLPSITEPFQVAVHIPDLRLPDSTAHSIPLSVGST